MAWVTISLRKQALRARIDHLNYQQISLSQQQQSMQIAGGYAISAMTAQKDRALNNAMTDHRNRLNNLQNSGGGQLTTAIEDENLRYQQEQMLINSVFQSFEDGQRNLTKSRETAISLEIETLKTQLMAVNQEYEALEKGLENDIKKDTIKLG